MMIALIEKQKDDIEKLHRRIDLFKNTRNEQVFEKLMQAYEDNGKLKLALLQLNAALDEFWNDPSRPSIAHMNQQTLLKLENAQCFSLEAIK